MTGLVSWSDARSLADLGVLVARWLEGGIEEWPGYGGRPDEETVPLVPSLAAACRAGFVTLNSQPGGRETVDGRVWEECAFVDGLVADDTLLTRLALQAWRFGVRVIVHHGPGVDPGDARAVGWVDGVQREWVGSRLDRDDVEFQFDGCHRDAVRQAADAWQVTLFEPSLLLGGRLWLTLDVVSGRYNGVVAS